MPRDASKLLLLSGVFALAASGATVDFTGEVLPIFQASCFACHSGPHAQAGLRLDTPGSRPSILPGNSTGSVLIHRILGQRGAQRMPPAGDPLTPEQVAVIRAWIDEGAMRPALDIDFVADIEPILKTSCYGCHAGAQPKAQLRLDVRSAAFAGGLSGPVIIPGDSGRSRLMHRIQGIAGEQRMPLKGTPLSDKQIALLGKWIDQGAIWPDSAAGASVAVERHWAYIKPVRRAPPAVRNGAWVRNPIDAFVLARLDKEGLPPSPEASKAALIRRVSLDLTGLPPTIREVDEFVADQSADAYEKLVDRLLRSPRYGERWALPWLDLARYADSNGYEKDRRRSIWKYRDWVIDALNRDMPFDQFTIEQLAGDLLPNATASQRIATGFNRNTLFNDENGVDQEEAHFETLVDRVNTTATVWLGSTIGCSQCHNHKFDPFTQKEYYQLFAFFNNADYVMEGDAANGRARLIEPKLELATAEQQAERDRLNAAITGLDKRTEARRAEIDAAQAKWEQEIAASRSRWTVLEPVARRSTAGTTLTRNADLSIVASGANPARDTYTIEAKQLRRSGAITGLRLMALPDPTLPRGGPGRDVYGNFWLTELTVEVIPAGEHGQAKPVAIRKAVADDGTLELGAGANQGWLVDATRETERQWRHAVYVFDKPIDASDGVVLRVRLRHESEISGKALGRFSLAVTTAEDPTPTATVPLRLRAALDTPRAERTEAQKSQLATYYESVTPLLGAEREQRTRIAKELERLEIPTTLVMRDLPDGQERPAHVHIRGGFRNLGELVKPGVPAVLHPLDGNQPENRLSLARWLVSKENPLVARVTVNRIWEQYFGQGLVETSEDFGTQGERPSHPELLDWLATEFMSHDWSMKEIHRLIVTSAMYRQSSVAKASLLERDPKNRLLARGPRFRMGAEMIRDTALAASGLLSAKIGGPSVFPPQPEGTWHGDIWNTSEGEDRHRRGLYTFAKRTSPYPAFIALDAPSREFCIVRRARTNTPLQALTTLNDPVFFEAAQALALRMLSEGGRDAAARATWGFRLSVSRHPRPEELERILDLYRKQLARFDRDPGAARKVAPGGAQTGQAESAAWTMVANVLLNLDEAITKE
ncbi:MAG: PSD1 and planctomycete cytochrome C domain-containing protein [Acidobacteriota bacterium]